MSPSDTKRNLIVQTLLLLLGLVLFFLHLNGMFSALWASSLLLWFSSVSLFFSLFFRWHQHGFFPWLMRALALFSLFSIGGIVSLSQSSEHTSWTLQQQGMILMGWGLLLLLISQFVIKELLRTRVYLFLWFPIFFLVRIAFPSSKDSIEFMERGFVVLLLMEGGIRALRTLFFPQYFSLLPRNIPHFFCHRFDPFRSVFSSLRTSLGIDIASARAFLFMKQSIVPLVCGLAIFLWLLSSVVLVHPHEQGIRFRFGVPEQEPLMAGLHLKWPWPWGEIKTVSSSRILSMKIGHEEEGRATEKDSILWANQHAEEEFSLLMGDQVNLIAVDGNVQYQISDPLQYVLSWQNPEEQLKDIAYQVLSRTCAERNLQEALSENLQELAEQVLKQIQKEMSMQSLGITPIAFTFSALHPPVTVAQDYQAVVSAQIDKESSLIRAQAYRTKNILKAQMDALVIKTKSQEDAFKRISEARGKAEAFRGLYETVHTSIDRYVFQRRLDVLNNNLKGIRMTIVDHTLEKEGAQLWIEE